VKNGWLPMMIVLVVIALDLTVVVIILDDIRTLLEAAR
jgi:hypothetical protein